MIKHLAPQDRVTVTEISRISDITEKYQGKINQPLYVVFLKSTESMEQLKIALKQYYRATFPKWLLICDALPAIQAEKLRSEAKGIFEKLRYVQMIAVCDESEHQRWVGYNRKTDEHDVATSGKAGEMSSNQKYSLHGKQLDVLMFKVMIGASMELYKTTAL